MDSSFPHRKHNPKPILILGAGISGLCFAQVLLKQHPTVPFRIYERDTVFNQRAQGYRVRLDSTGQNALKACLSEELYERLKKCCAQSSKEWDHYARWMRLVGRGVKE